jgi:hypothetical protein
MKPMAGPIVPDKAKMPENKLLKLVCIAGSRRCNTFRCQNKCEINALRYVISAMEYQ